KSIQLELENIESFRDLASFIRRISPPPLHLSYHSSTYGWYITLRCEYMCLYHCSTFIEEKKKIPCDDDYYEYTVAAGDDDHNSDNKTRLRRAICCIKEWTWHGRARSTTQVSASVRSEVDNSRTRRRGHGTDATIQRMDSGHTRDGMREEPSCLYFHSKQTPPPLVSVSVSCRHRID
ncbi:hypothetical protein U1Q18_050343, partial [Sarracenia purpurea var. burkii]